LDGFEHGQSASGRSDQLFARVIFERNLFQQSEQQSLARKCFQAISLVSEGDIKQKNSKSQ
jgi:hypothetical protein